MLNTNPIIIFFSFYIRNHNIDYIVYSYYNNYFVSTSLLGYVHLYFNDLRGTFFILFFLFFFFFMWTDQLYSYYNIRFVHKQTVICIVRLIFVESSLFIRTIDARILQFNAVTCVDNNIINHRVTTVYNHYSEFQSMRGHE